MVKSKIIALSPETYRELKLIKQDLGAESLDATIKHLINIYKEYLESTFEDRAELVEEELNLAFEEIEKYNKE